MIYSIKMILLPKKVFLVFFVVTLCTNLSYADDHDNSNFVEISDVNTGRDLSLAAASHPAVAVGSGLVTLGLLGSTLALVSGTAASNRRSYDPYDPYYYDERQDIIAAGNARYANNVKSFEDRTFRAAARSALRGMRNMRKSSRRLGKGLRKHARAMSHNTAEGFRALARSSGQMAKSAGKSMHSVARMAGRGLATVGTVARRGMGSVGLGLSRMGLRTQKFGRKLAGVGVAAARGLAHVSDSYRRNAIEARSALGNGIYAVGTGISRVGNAASRGYRGYLNRLGTAYKKSIRRLGYVRPSLENAVQDSVSRIGELASVSAAKFGGLATDVTDQVSRVAEVASDLPKSLSNVAQEKKVQDCFLQAMCYISTPYLSQNEVKRRKRALKSVSENGGWEKLPNNAYDDEEFGEEYKDFNDEYRGNEYFDNNVHMDDCEVFECSVASFGRKVIGAVRKFGDR